tara:strand:- start:119 stop:685 length:567 start_codon:yes stop_codon:yes gene_type:complete
MGTIKTTNIEPIADNGTVTLGSSGDTFSLGSGVKQSNIMNPAFQAYLSATQSVSDGVTTKVQFDAEDLDTDNCYDNSTNYRFTPTIAGKYFVFSTTMHLNTSNNNLVNIINYIYKNGSSISRTQFDFQNNFTKNGSLDNSLIVDMNGSSDYLEIFASVNTSSGGSPSFYGASASSNRWCRFGAYRIGS